MIAEVQSLPFVPFGSQTIYGVSQPPTLLDEQPWGEVQLKVNVAVGVEFGLTPRAIHMRLQPRRH